MPNDRTPKKWQLARENEKSERAKNLKLRKFSVIFSVGSFHGRSLGILLTTDLKTACQVLQETFGLIL